jgi:hypothetical protein
MMKPLIIVFCGWLACAATPLLQAQTYNVNVVGYYTLVVPSGFSMIANNLNDGANRVSDVLTNGVVDGMVLYKLDTTNQVFSANVFEGGVWADPTESFAPGEGGFLFNPGNPVTLTFVGAFTVGSNTNSLPAGLSLVSSTLPFSGRLDTGLNFPVANGDVIYRFDNASGAYKVYTFDFGSWTTPPEVNVGESWFVWKAAAANWVQTYNF